MSPSKIIYVNSPLYIGFLWVQYMFFIVYFIFAIFGCFFLGIARGLTWAPKEYNIVMDFASEPTVIMIIIGGLLLFLAFYGSFATVKKDLFFIGASAGLASVPFMLEILLVARGFVVQNTSYSIISKSMEQGLGNYTNPDRSDIKTDWDYMQFNLNCCGIFNSSDWAETHVEGFEIVEFGHSYTVPYSCCADLSFHVQCHNISTAGCMEILSDYVSYGNVVITYSTIAIAIIQILFVIFTCLVIHMSRSDRPKIKKAESEEGFEEIGDKPTPSLTDLEAPSTSDS